MGPADLSDRLVIVISGPGGVGKGTLVAELMAHDPALWLSRSWSSRERRPGEAGDAYHFVSRRRFDDHIEAGGFLEWVDFLDYRQGTPLPDPPPDHDVVFEIDVHGGIAVRERFPQTLLLFIDTPDRSEQRSRLEGRGDAADVVEARLERGDDERRLAADAGYRTVVNDRVERATGELAAIISEARTRR